MEIHLSWLKLLIPALPQQNRKYFGELTVMNTNTAFRMVALCKDLLKSRRYLQSFGFILLFFTSECL